MSAITEKDIRVLLVSNGLIENDTQLGSDDSLFDANVLDSLRMIEFVGELEQVYHIKIKPSDLTSSNFDSLNGIAELVNQRRSEAPA